MLDDKSSTAWRPANRPDWVERINAEGRHLDSRALIPLDGDHLIAAACRNTGLSDFGDEDWREPFEILTTSLETEANLNLVGRLMTGADLLANLEARLRIEEGYRRHPEIADERITKPIIILGQPRTGTSALQNVLAADPRNLTIRTFEAWYPVPLSTAPDDEQLRIARAEALMGMWNRVTPELTSQHEVNALIPTECNLIHGLSFRSQTMVHLGQIPSYRDYMATADMMPAFRYHARVLKLLQFNRGGGRWALKSPDYLALLPQLLTQYPDAALVFTHRDPVKAFGSVVSLLGTLQWQRSDTVFQYDSHDCDAINRSNMAVLLNNMADMVASGRLSQDQLLSVQFREIAADPIAVVAKIYDHFDISPDNAALASMRSYCEASREARIGHSHAYTIGTADEVTKARTLFSRYQAYFDVPNEA